MRVSGITPQKRNGRYNVFIDGNFSFGLDELTLVREGVRVGLEVDSVWIKKLTERGTEGALYIKTLSFLAIRPRSLKEINDYLYNRLVVREKNDKSEALRTISVILERLEEGGFVDDFKFSKWLVSQRREGNKPKGDRAIRFELIVKGIKADVVDKALKRGPEDTAVSEEALARAVLKRKETAYKKLSKKERTSKISAFLLRRGFSWDTIRSVIRECEDEDNRF